MPPEPAWSNWLSGKDNFYTRIKLYIFLVCAGAAVEIRTSRARAARGSVIEFSFSLISAKASSTMALLPAAMRSILRARSTRVRRAARDLQAGGGGGGCSREERGRERLS